MVDNRGGSRCVVVDVYLGRLLRGKLVDFEILLGICSSVKRNRYSRLENSWELMKRFSDRKCKLHFHNEDVLDEST